MNKDVDALDAWLDTACGVWPPGTLVRVAQVHCHVEAWSRVRRLTYEGLRVVRTPRRYVDLVGPRLQALVPDMGPDMVIVTSPELLRVVRDYGVGADTIAFLASDLELHPSSGLGSESSVRPEMSNNSRHQNPDPIAGAMVFRGELWRLPYADRGTLRVL
jgi:hypothetical protein